MSRQFRHRVTALALGGFLLGAPLLASGTAHAGPTRTGDREVVFGGDGVLGLSCRSRPEVASMTVPSESTVRLVNRTGHRAELRLAGATKGVVPDDGSTEVVFRRGTTAVLLTPSCALGRKSTPFLVTAEPSATGSAPNPIPVPPSVPSATPTSPGGTGSGTPTSSGSSGSGSATPPRNTPTATATQRPTTSRPGPTRTTLPTATIRVPARPQGGPAPRNENDNDTPQRRTGQDAVAGPPAGVPPTGDTTTPAATPTSAVPSPARPEPAGTTGVPAPGVVPTTDVPAAAEPVAALEPMPSNSRIGLLALVAMVCVTGVTIGAIRAIVSERASRTMIA